MTRFETTLRRARDAGQGLIPHLGWLVAIPILMSAPEVQWDFRVFHTAWQAARAGFDPYALANIETMSGQSNGLRFFYPPITLHFFGLFGWLPYDSARIVWLGAEAAALALVVEMWRRHFLRGVSNWALAAVVPLGFSVAVLWDLQAGNVTIFENLLLWIGFAFVVRGRKALGAAGIVLGALFKICPIALLGLLFVLPPRRDSVRAAGVAAVAFGLLSLVQFAWHPDWIATFGHNLETVRETGSCNPCLLAICDDYCPKHAEVAWLLGAIVLLGVSLRTFGRLARTGTPLASLVFTLLVYALVAPRFKSYSYMLLIPPALLVAHALPRVTGSIAVALLCIPTDGHPLGLAPLPVPYYPWFLALALWLMCVMNPTVLERIGQPEGARARLPHSVDTLSQAPDLS